mmetsp:Transcript_11887/g.18886  ORF Transcript_11887/g.18886 Transcript_11887/m.18886 type:complete len:121 (-) Transcript_11887:2516-2878(-)
MRTVRHAPFATLPTDAAPALLPNTNTITKTNGGFCLDTCLEPNQGLRLLQVFELGLALHTDLGSVQAHYHVTWEIIDRLARTVAKEDPLLPCQVLVLFRDQGRDRQRDRRSLDHHQEHQN